jgi:polyketide synthase 12
MARQWSKEMIRPFTIGVVLIMVAAALVLRILQNTDYGQQVLEKQTAEMPDLDTLLDQVMPSEEQIDQAFQPHLDTEDAQSKDIGIITKDGQLLRARLSKPAGSGPFPVIIILHDGPSSTRATDEAAKLWGESLSHEYDAMTLTLDWRESQMGEEEVTDVVSAIDWVRKLRESTDQPILLFGMDHGVYLALAAMETHSEYVDGLIAAYGYSDVKQQYHFLAEHDARGAENFLDDTGCAEETAVELCLEGQSVTSVDIAVPLLVMHGRADTVVPSAQSEQIATQATDPSAVTTVYSDDPAVDHFFLDNEDNAGFTIGENAVNDWLKKQL